MLRAMADLSVAEQIVASLAVIGLGYFAARSTVALADTHRLDLPDRWLGPVCTGCGEALDMTLVRCAPSRHRQRPMNLIVLISMPVLFIAVTLSLPSLWLVPAYLVFTYAMVLLTVTDLDTKLIPNRMLFPLTAAGGALLLVGGLFADDWVQLAWAVVGAAGYFSVMFILALIARGALGFGDVKLALLIGLFTGYLGWGYVIIAGVGGFILGGVISLLLIVTRRANRKDSIPFGPFMTAGGIIAVIWGESIINWYLG